MTSKSRIKKMVNLAIGNKECLKNDESILLPVSYEDLINSAEVVFEDFIPLEVTTIKNNDENKCIEYDGNKCIENVPVNVEPFNDTIEIQSSDNTLLLESDIISLNDLEININELIQNDFSGVQENSNLDNCVEINSNLCKTKRKRNVYPDNTKWKRETNKKLRMKGEAYIGFRRLGNVVQQDISRSERSLLDTCSSNVCLKSKNRFCSTFTQEQRQDIFKHFWDASWEEKETFVLGTVLVTDVKRKTTEEDTRRSKTYNYHLRYKNSLPIQVCKKMYLNTLCLKEWMVLNWVKKSEHGIPNQRQLISIECSDTNNESLPQYSSIQGISRRLSYANKLSYLKNWFDSLPKLPSHYCRKRTERIYFEGPFKDVQAIYNLYTEKCISDKLAPFSKAFFVKFKKENKFSIFKPRKDKCDMCASYEVGQVSENKIAVHIAHKDRARAEKELDKQLAKENKVHVFTMDMQAVKLCPYLQASALYYSMKLKVHNLTIYNIGNAECHNYWWYETEGNLEASVFTTILIKHLEKVCLDKKPIVIYTDGCGYQNRNVVLSNGLLKYSMKYQVNVQQKYLIKGHTQMEVDSTHSLIERNLKEKDIFLPTDYVRCTLNARKYPTPLNAQLLTHTYFNDYKQNLIYNSIRPGKTVGDPECKDLRGLLYDPTGTMYYKLTFDDPWAELPQRTTRNKTVFTKEVLQPLYTGPLKLTKSKWDDLQKLKKVLPVDVHPFYDQLPYESVFKERKQKI